MVTGTGSALYSPLPILFKQRSFFFFFKTGSEVFQADLKFAMWPEMALNV